MSIFRTALCITALAFLLPSPPQKAEPAGAGPNPAAPAPSEFVFAAIGLVTDARDFCGRQPAVCQTTGYIAQILAAKAMYNFELLYQWMGTETPPAAPQGDKGDPVTTGSGGTKPPVAPAPPSPSTLTIKDLLMEWHPPASDHS